MYMLESYAAIQQRGIFIVPRQLWYRTSVFSGFIQSIASISRFYVKQVVLSIYII